jgi:hypothetical protein
LLVLRSHGPIPKEDVCTVSRVLLIIHGSRRYAAQEALAAPRLQTPLAQQACPMLVLFHLSTQDVRF